ncbi:MAG: hypothetical protein AAGD05_11410, partial [Bacteroidota bacterium]
NHPSISNKNEPSNQASGGPKGLFQHIVPLRLHQDNPIVPNKRSLIKRVLFTGMMLCKKTLPKYHLN